jgi:beta-glucuronidase
MRRLLFFLFVLAAVASCYAVAGPSSLINNIPNRTTVSLNGSWHYIVDPYETGLKARFYLDAKPKDKQELVEYDFDKSDVLNVPGDWNTQKKELFFYEGPIWYEKSFSYHKHEHNRVFVNFGAANYFTRVYLNGEAVGEHEGGFTAFNFEVTDKIHDGDNFLIVEVNNARRLDAVPSLNTDWWNYGGITRDVVLVEEPETFIQDYVVQLAKGSNEEVSGWVQITPSRSEQQVTLEIPEAGISKKIVTSVNGYAEFHFLAKLDLWSPDHPKLYEVVLSSGADKVHDSIGFRSIATRGTQILLNGKPIFLRGVSMHEEAPNRGGRAYTQQDAETLLKWAKELGCNFVRFAHYPYSENMTRLADRMGLMVWSEIPVYWDIDWQNPATLQNAKNQLQDMIARDHNRASVVFWSLSNETPVKPERTVFLHQLADTARELDSTRLIASALNHVEESGPDTRTLNDPVGEYLDVLGLNEYLGWYWGRPEDADRMQWKNTWDKPLIMSEFGGGAPYGRHGAADERWTEEYQASIFMHQITMLKKIPSLAGLSPWCLMDFHSPRRLLSGVQDYYNRKGLVSIQGQQKQAFYVLQKYYRELEAAK